MDKIPKIKIFTDSACDLPEDILTENDISVVPFKITINENTYLDGKTISTAKLYNLVEEYNELPKTGAPSTVEYYKAFEPYVEKGFEVIHIGLSSRLSSALNNAKIAAEQFPGGQIKVVDSLNLSTGIGLLVMKAVDMVKQDKSGEEIVRILREKVNRVRTSFVIDSFDYLHKGGRCTSLQKFIGKILNFKVRIKVEQGKMDVAEVIRGGRRRVLHSLFKDIKKEKDIVEPPRIFITHSHHEKGANYLRKNISEMKVGSEVVITEAGSVISSHCGPGTVGVLYISNHK